MTPKVSRRTDCHCHHRRSQRARKQRVGRSPRAMNASQFFSIGSPGWTKKGCNQSNSVRDRGVLLRISRLDGSRVVDSAGTECSATPTGSERRVDRTSSLSTANRGLCAPDSLSQLLRRVVVAVARVRSPCAGATPSRPHRDPPASVHTSRAQEWGPRSSRSRHPGQS